MGGMGRPITRKERKMAREMEPSEDYEFIYRKFITLRNGKRLYASAYGLTAFKLKVRRR
jgi:hypothetical protein